MPINLDEFVSTVNASIDSFASDGNTPPKRSENLLFNRFDSEETYCSALAKELDCLHKWGEITDIASALNIADAAEITDFDYIIYFAKCAIPFALYEQEILDCTSKHGMRLYRKLRASILALQPHGVLPDGLSSLEELRKEMGLYATRTTDTNVPGQCHYSIDHLRRWCDLNNIVYDAIKRGADHSQQINSVDDLSDADVMAFFVRSMLGVLAYETEILYCVSKYRKGLYRSLTYAILSVQPHHFTDTFSAPSDPEYADKAGEDTRLHALRVYMGLEVHYLDVFHVANMVKAGDFALSTKSGQQLVAWGERDKVVPSWFRPYDKRLSP